MATMQNLIGTERLPKTSVGKALTAFTTQTCCTLLRAQGPCYSRSLTVIVMTHWRQQLQSQALKP